MTRQKKKNNGAKGQKPVAPKEVNSRPGPSTASTSASTSRQKGPARGNGSRAEPQARYRPPSPSFESQYIQLMLESDMIPPSLMPPPPTFPDIPGFPRNPDFFNPPRPEYDVPLPEGASPLPEGFPLTQKDLEVAYAHFALLEDEDSRKFEEASIEYEMALRAALECEPETEEDYEDMKEIWESLERVKKNMIPPIDLRGRHDTTRACSSQISNLMADIDNGIARHRRFPDRPSTLPIDPNDGRPISQLPMDDDEFGEGPSSSGPSSSNAGPSTSEDGSPSYSPSSPLDGEGEQCAIELRAATDDTDNSTNSFCPSPVNSSESEPEIRVVNEIKANPRTRAAHERLMRERKTRPIRASINLLEQIASQQPIDVQFGFEASQAAQQPCSSASVAHIDTSVIEFSFDPHWPTDPKKADAPIKKAETNPIDLSALARALEGLTDATAIQEAYKNAYEKKLTDLTTENQLVTAENMKLKEKLIELEKKLDARSGKTCTAEAPTQPPHETSNNNKKKNKKKGKK